MTSDERHLVELHDVRSPVTDLNPVEPYFAAICSCGWVEAPLVDEDEARERARRHSSNVDPVVKHPLDGEWGDPPQSTIDKETLPSGRGVRKSVLVSAALALAMVFIVLSGLIAGGTPSWYDGRAARRMPFSICWAISIPGLLFFGGILVHDLRDWRAGRTETRMRPLSMRGLAGYIALGVAMGILFEAVLS